MGSLFWSIAFLFTALIGLADLVSLWTFGKVPSTITLSIWAIIFILNFVIAGLNEGIKYLKGKE